MKVGIDARKLWDGGIGTYIRGLVTALALQGCHELVVLLEPRQRGRVTWPGGVREVEVSAGKYGVAEHFVVPWIARRAGVELLHEPHYTLPFAWTGPAVVTIHDLTHIRFARYFPPGAALYARVVAGTAAHRARVVLADSAHTREDIIRYLAIPSAKIRVVPLGVSDALRRPSLERRAAFARERRLPSDYLLYVGARKRAKNLETLLDAIARIAPGSRPPLVLSGRPWAPSHRLARRAESLGLGAGVHFSGDLENDEELACLYAGAVLYLHPSLAEGFGLPPLEAMACGTPVISSDAGSLAETVGDVAMTLPPLDVDGWNRAIESLLGDDARRAELVRRGLDHAAGFTWARTATLTAAAYQEAMAW